MEKIKKFIEKEKHIFQSRKINLIIENKIKNQKDINIKKEKLLNEYDKWITKLSMSLYKLKFRQVLTEIESSKNNYIFIPEEHWRFQIIQIKCIFHIIKKKIKKYDFVLSKDNSHQNRSISFWFNQTVFILEQLNLKFRDDINEYNLKSKEALVPIQKIYQGYIELIYLLIKYSYIRSEYQELFAYLSMVDSLYDYYIYVADINSLPFLQRIYLIRAKLYLANCDYLGATKYLKKTIDLCTNQLIYVVDYRLNFAKIDFLDKDVLISFKLNKQVIKILQNALINIVLDFYLKGVLSELLGSTTRAIDSYKQSKFFATKFLKNKFYNFTMFFYHLQNNGFRYLAVMDEFKKYKDEAQIKAKLNYDIMMKKKRMKRLRYQKNYSKYYSKIRVNHNLYKGNLKHFLDDVGIKMFKEEENKQGVLCKFSKAKFITSNINIINIMLSKNFTNTLKKINKIEISKASKETTDYINNILNKNNLEFEQDIYKDKYNNSKSIDISINKSMDKNFNQSSINNLNNNNSNIFKINLDKKSETTKHSLFSNKKINLNSYESKKYNEKNKYNFKHHSAINKVINNNRYSFLSPINNNNISSSFHKKNFFHLIKNNYNNNSKSLFYEKKTNESSRTNKILKKNMNKSETSILDTIDNDNNNSKYLFKYNFNINNNKKHNLSSINSSYKNMNMNFSLKRPKIPRKLTKIKFNQSSKDLKKEDEYKIDKDYFNKSLIQKKNYIDKFCSEEIKFHRKLLKAKSCEIEPFKEELPEFDSKKVQLDAELSYDRILEICKSSINKKSFGRFFKNIKMIKEGAFKDDENKKNKNFKQQNSQEYHFDNDSFDINILYKGKNFDTNGKNIVFNNNDKKIKTLDMECELVNIRENELKNKDKKLFIKIFKNGKNYFKRK